MINKIHYNNTISADIEVHKNPFFFLLQCGNYYGIILNDKAVFIFLEGFLHEVIWQDSPEDFWIQGDHGHESYQLCDLLFTVHSENLPGPSGPDSFLCQADPETSFQNEILS